MGYNPWKVASIQAFSCIKCPQCAFYTKEENYFERHAMSNHPLSFVLFGKFEDDSFEISNPDKISNPEEIPEQFTDTDGSDEGDAFEDVPMEQGTPLQEKNNCVIALEDTEKIEIEIKTCYYFFDW